MSTTFSIDPRLLADTHVVGGMALSEVLLMDDMRFPWLILVPRIAGARELIDLDAADRNVLSGEINVVGRALESIEKPDKLNFASLGNVVSQLHLHIIARRIGDAAWPQPVWNHGERVVYSTASRDARIAALKRALGSALE